MPPPQLPADAPILDLAHPFEIHGGPVVRHETNVARLDGADGGFRQRLDVDEPLIGEQGLEDGVAAIAARHGELVRLDMSHQPKRLEVRENLRSRSAAIHAAVGGGHFIVEGGVRVHDVDQGQAMTLPDFVIVEVMRGRNLDAAAAEGGVDVGVADDGNFARGERQADAAADQMPIALIVGMHGNRGVAQHGLRPGGRDDQKTVARHQGIAQMPQAAVFFLCDHLEIRQRGLQHRVPIHHALAAINQAFLVQPHENFGHRFRQAGIHGEAVAPPIDRGAEPAHLIGDLTAGLLLPFPDARDECFAPEIDPALTGGIQLSLHHHLRGDAGVIRARLPQSIEALHSPVANQRIHDGVLKGVPHVQGTGHIGRRNDDGIGGAAAPRRKIPGSLPCRVQAGFDVGGRVGLIHAFAVRS